MDNPITWIVILGVIQLFLWWKKPNKKWYWWIPAMIAGCIFVAIVGLVILLKIILP